MKQQNNWMYINIMAIMIPDAFHLSVGTRIKVHQPMGYTPDVDELCDGEWELDNICTRHDGTIFDYVFVRLTRKGKKYCGWHPRYVSGITPEELQQWLEKKFATIIEAGINEDLEH